MAITNEAEMATAVAKHFKYSAREVRLGNHILGSRILDVVAYDKKKRLFRVIECKLGSDATRITQAFGQISGYHAEINGRPHKFVDAYTEQIHLRWGRLMEATHANRYIQVAFYVALMDDACKEQIDTIRAQKELHPNVGVIRVKDDRTVRHSLRVGGKKDNELAKASSKVIAILHEMADQLVGASLKTA